METRTFIRRTCIVVAIALAGLALAGLLGGLIYFWLLVFAGILLAVLLRVAVDGFARLTHLGPKWSFGIVLVLFFALIGGLGWVLVPMFTDQMEEFTGSLQQSIDALWKRLEQTSWGGLLVNQTESMEPSLEQSWQFGQWVGAFFSSALDVVVGILFILFVGIFLAANPELYKQGLLRLIPLGSRKRISELLEKLGTTLRWWLVGQLVSMVVLGTQIGLGLWLLGVPMALMLGLLSAVMTFIPYVGPVIATVPIVLIALTESPTLALYALLLCIAVQNIEGYAITPLIHQKAVHIPPALTIGAQLMMGLLVGPLGVVLATPLAAVGLVTVRRLYVEDVLGDSLQRPALASGEGDIGNPEDRKSKIIRPNTE
jgi:predicted PurR-regulated permease PerM